MLQGQPHGEHLRPFTTVAIVYLLLYGFLCAYHELGIYHTLQLRGHIRHIKLSLPPSILHKALVLMDGSFPILEHLSLICSSSADSGHRLPLTLSKAFLAPNLLHLTLYDIGLPKRLRVLNSPSYLESRSREASPQRFKKKARREKQDGGKNGPPRQDMISSKISTLHFPPVNS